MKILAGTICITTLMLISTSHDVSARPVPLPSNAAIRLAADTASTPDRNTYIERAKNEMQEWQRKLHDSGEQAEAQGKTASNSAKGELNEAWSKTEAAFGKLQNASADGWESAEASFETASHNLADTWHRIHPEAK